MLGLSPNTTYKFKVAAINSAGTSTFSPEILITTTATICTITHDLAFVQTPISYVLGTTAVSFQIPTYTISGCVGETINYYCECMGDSNGENWSPPSDGLISLSGGSIYESNTIY